MCYVITRPGTYGAADFELGVIAGTKNYRPLIAKSVQGPNDGTVTVEETKLKGMTDFIALPTTHTFMMWDDSVLEQTLYFLQQGQFKPF